MSNLNGPRYPTAPNAWPGGIMFLPVVREELPHVDHSGDFHHHLILPFTALGQSHIYRLVPQCVGPVTRAAVAYYVAYNQADGRNDYAISPESLDDFAARPGTFLIAARNWWAFNSSNWQVAANQVGYLASQGQFKAAIRALGRSWLEALQDPGWWTMVVVSAAGLVGSGGSAGGAEALRRLQSTQANLLGQAVRRTPSVLSESQVFRHTLTADMRAASFARIEAEGSLNLSQGYKAHYGEGVYAWGAAQERVGAYIDIEVPPGTAVETIQVNNQTFYRLLPATGDRLPVKIVGTNLPEQEMALGRLLIKER